MVDTYILYINFKFDFRSPLDLSSDGVYAYTVEVLSLGLFYSLFKDAIKEGNGEHVLRSWKYFIPIFKASRRTNYSIEAFLTLYQYYYNLSPRQAHQLMWSRFVKAHLVTISSVISIMEYLNRLCKVSIKNMGVNKTEKAIECASKGIHTTAAIVQRFDDITSIGSPSDKHSSTSYSRDRDLILKVLTRIFFKGGKTALGELILPWEYTTLSRGY